MNSELQLVLLNIGTSDSSYSKEIWYEIIDSLLDDFQKFIGCHFERDNKDYIRLNLKYPRNPTFTTGLWLPEDEDNKQVNKYSKQWLNLINNELLTIENKDSLLSIKWSGVLGGCITGATIKNGKCEDVFNANITLFLFDPIDGKRLSLKSGKDIIEFSFTPKSDGSGEWKSLGWLEDIYGEWKNRQSWFD